MQTDLATLLRQIQTLWESQIRSAKESKERDFGRSAADVMRFAGKRYKRIAMEPKVDATSEAMGPDDPEFVAIYNLTDAFRSTMVPYVFSQVHDFLVSPRRPQMPPELASLLPEMAEQQKMVRTRDTMTCFLMQWLLNYFPKLYNLEREGRMVVDEALVKGRGTVWATLDDGPTGAVPACYADSVDNFYVDADCKQLREAGWICQKVDESIYKIADRYSEDPHFLRGHASTNLQQAVDSTVQAVDVTLLASEHNDPEVTKRDIGTYYRIWSRVGLGHKFVGAPDDMTTRDGKIGAFFEAMEKIGPYVHFAIMPGMNRPLGMKAENLAGDAGIPTERTESDMGAGPGPESPVDASNPNLLQVLTEKLQWPIKTYGDLGNPWPVKCFDPKPNVDNPWAKSPLEAALPIQEVMDYIYNTVTVRVRAAGRDIAVVSSAIEKGLREALASCDDLPIIPIQGAVTKEEMDKIIGFVRFPEMNKDIFEVLPILERAFMRITGMDDAMQGQNPRTQERSAAASQLKAKGVFNRADDYAKRAEIWMSEVAEVCGVITRQYVDVETVAPLFGEPVQDDPMGSGQKVYGYFSQAFINNIQLPQDDPNTPYIAAAEYEYGVAAGSGQPKNLQLYQANADRMWQMFGAAAFTGGMQTGDFQPWVELATLVGDAYRMPIQAFLDAFVRMAQIQVQMQQQGMAPPPGQEGPGGGPRPREGESPAQEGKSMPGGNALASSWAKAAGKPQTMSAPPPPSSIG